MAYVKPTSEYFDTEKKEVIDRLLKFKEPFVFDGETSLDALSKDLSKRRCLRLNSFGLKTLKINCARLPSELDSERVETDS